MLHRNTSFAQRYVQRKGWQLHFPAHAPVGEAKLKKESLMIFAIDPLIALGVFVCTAVTDAAYVMFSASIVAKRRFSAANWSGLWYLLSAFAVISYTQNAAYVLFAAAGSWVGAFCTVTWLRRGGNAQPHA